MNGLGELDKALSWSAKKFAGVTPMAALEHAAEELSELAKEVSNGQISRITEEACDLAVLALATALAAGATQAELASEVRRKLEVNKKRKWAADGRHVETT